MWAEQTIPPTDATRLMALESIAVLDVVNAIHDHPEFLVTADAPDGISEAAAIAAAAEHVLSALLPGQKASLAADLAQSLDGVPDGAAEDKGVAFGRAVADAVLAARAHDGSNSVVHDPGSHEPGAWHPTLPAYAPAVSPQWGAVTPFTLTSADQFQPPGPPAMTSSEYAAALNEVKEFGSATSTARTADQTEIAIFWANDSGTYTAPGHLDHIAIDIAKQAGTGVEESALMLAELDVAMADAAIAAWNAKYTDAFWRPIEAIRHADADGNAATTADPDWLPLLPTPSHPEYPSGHAVFAGAWASVMEAFYGNMSFSATSAELPGVTRHFDSFADAAAEDAQSRIYAGVHYQFSAQDGLALGKDVAGWVQATFHQDGLLQA
ncbi:vanadium-dependent haloperoxidase [Methylobacterium nigriterrae]|uniref:vanadium-dependent haloperoxidase n=1 Tax=Methylobacterium nigriterrae TaxID=3127512 RepID=UPI003014123C